MTLVNHFQMLARYNRIANERVYAACAELDDAEYRRQRRGSFGSIHGLLNHLLLGDGIWMGRFAGTGGAVTPALNSVLAEEFAQLRTLRVEQDARIEDFFKSAPDDFFERTFAYRNNKGVDYVEQAPVAVAHFFNHQTHHRGQIHIMLSQTTVAPPSLDMHRILNP